MFYTWLSLFFKSLWDSWWTELDKIFIFSNFFHFTTMGQMTYIMIFLIILNHFSWFLSITSWYFLHFSITYHHHNMIAQCILCNFSDFCYIARSLSYMIDIVIHKKSSWQVGLCGYIHNFLLFCIHSFLVIFLHFIFPVTVLILLS